MNTAATVTATATAGTSAITRLEFQLDGITRSALSTASGSWALDTTSIANGAHTLTMRAWDSAGNLGTASLAFQVNNPVQAALALPTAPQHYSHIRIAELAYSGNPMGSYEQSLLQTSVDLVVPNPSYLATIDSVAPNTPQLIYTNLSNLYGSLYSDWLNYADAHGVSREQAFYHVSKAMAFSGSSSGSQPVTWFWSVYQTSTSGSSSDFTSLARGGSVGNLNWDGSGQSLYFGYTDKFRELNVNVSRAAESGWNGVWEYATVNSSGQTTWHIEQRVQVRSSTTWRSYGR